MKKLLNVDLPVDYVESSGAVDESSPISCRLVKLREGELLLFQMDYDAALNWFSEYLESHGDETGYIYNVIGKISLFNAESNDKGNINNNINTANEINNINNNNDTNNNKEQQNNKEEEKSEPKKQLESAVSKYSNAQKLRKLLSQKNKQKLEILRKYFHKFNEGGIILSLRKSTKRSLLYKKIEGVDFEIALRAVINNQGMNDIDVDDKTDEKEFKKEFDKKMKDKRFSMQVEKVRFDSRKKRQLELEEIEETNKKKYKNLEIIFNKADRRNKVILKKYFDIYYLKSKVMSLSNYERRERRSKTTKIKRKTKKRSVIFNLDNNEILDSNDILHRVNSGTKIGLENKNEEMDNKSEQDDKNEK